MDPEFSEGQINFFSKHCNTFTDDEENRHEYKEIHEEYITILEVAIEAILTQNFTEDQIKSFYMDFAENFDSYKTLHDDAYTVMCGSIDFKKFKEEMLKFKKSTTIDTSQDQKQNFGASGADKFFELAAEDFNDPKLKWSKVVEMKNDKDGFSGYAYRRPLETGSAATMIMSEMRYIGVKKERYLELMKNGPPTKNIKEVKVLKENGPNERYLYIRFELGGFISDRDNVVRKTEKDIGDGCTLLTIESYDMDVPEVPGVLRMDAFVTCKLRQDPEKPEDLLVTEYSNFDMKGYFPSRIMNMVLSSILPKMQKEMREKLG